MLCGQSLFCSEGGDLVLWCQNWGRRRLGLWSFCIRLFCTLKLGLAILSVTSLLTGEGPELSVGWQEQPHTQLRCRVAFGSPLTWPGL